jgi:uncharacterized protein YndB with AHSA1/START domain
VESTTERVAVTRELVIDASPETVWEFLTDPEKIKRWKGVLVSFDATAGAAYRIEVIPTHIAAGKVVELDPPHRLVYTWGWESGEQGDNAVPPGTSTVEIELLPAGDTTTLRFKHSGLPGSEAAESHAHGWDHYLERLVTAAGGGDPGADPWLSGQM